MQSESWVGGHCTKRMASSDSQFLPGKFWSRETIYFWHFVTNWAIYANRCSAQSFQELKQSIQQKIREAEVFQMYQSTKQKILILARARARAHTPTFVDKHNLGYQVLGVWFFLRIWPPVYVIFMYCSILYFELNISMVFIV